MSYSGAVPVVAVVLASLVFVAPGFAQSTAPDSATPASTFAAGPSYGTNLVVNGDAEAELGASDNGHLVTPSGWKTTGQFTAVAYGAVGGFPDSKSPGPTNRGKSLFEGGHVAKSAASQKISLEPFAEDIAAGGVVGTFSSWIGGYSTQPDYAVVSITYLDGRGAKLTTYSLGPVRVAERKGLTSSRYAYESTTIPKRAKAAVVTMVMTRLEGTYNDASVDNVSLVLTSKATP